MPDYTECCECGEVITTGANVASGVLYENGAGRLESLEAEIRRNLKQMHGYDDAQIFAWAFKDAFDCEPTDLVEAVRHRLEEEQR